MLPKVNQMIYLHIASPDEEESGIEYKTRIADSGENNYYIEIPMNEKTGKLKRLYLGEELSAYFVTEGGMKNYFNTHVTGFKEDVIRLVAVSKPDPEQVTTIQRRNFLRVAAALELAVKRSDQVRFVVMTDDVGGGGISFLTEGAWLLKSGDVLECWLLIPYKQGSVDHAKFTSEIVRVKPLESGRAQVMCKFTDITDGERQKIIRFCFERQFELRK
ncbi:flagellar brake protein [Paenibacillus tarimensis]